MSEIIDIRPRIARIRSTKPFQAELVIEPLKRGYGHTLGNALRRVMMSSVPGCAVTEVSIEGVPHEYDRVEGMREDVMLLLLNIRNVVFKIIDGEQATVSIRKEGPCVVTAADIVLPHNVEVINSEHVLASLTEKGRLSMEMVIRRGVGYEPTSAREDVHAEEKSFGSILMDANFSPVKRAAFRVDGARVANRTDLDRLIFDIETDGSVDYKDVVEHSAAILVSQFKVLTSVDIDEMATDPADETQRGRAGGKVLSESISDLDLTPRVCNLLASLGIHTVADLVSKSGEELMSTPKMGKKALNEIKAALEKRSLCLSDPSGIH